MAPKRTVVEEMVVVLEFDAKTDDVKEYEAAVDSLTGKVTALGVALTAFAFQSTIDLRNMARETSKEWESVLEPIDFNLRRIGESGVNSLGLIKQIAQEIPRVDLVTGGEIVRETLGTPGVEAFGALESARVVAAMSAITNETPQDIAYQILELAKATHTDPETAAAVALRFGGTSNALRLADTYLQDSTTFAPAAGILGIDPLQMFSVFAELSLKGGGSFDKVSGRLEPVMQAMFKREGELVEKAPHLIPYIDQGDLIGYLEEVSMLRSDIAESAFGEDAIGVIRATQDLLEELKAMMSVEELKRSSIENFNETLDSLELNRFQRAIERRETSEQVASIAFTEASQNFFTTGEHLTATINEMFPVLAGAMHELKDSWGERAGGFAEEGFGAFLTAALMGKGVLSDWFGKPEMPPDPKKWTDRDYRRWKRASTGRGHLFRGLGNLMRAAPVLGMSWTLIDSLLSATDFEGGDIYGATRAPAMALESIFSASPLRPFIMPAIDIASRVAEDRLDSRRGITNNNTVNISGNVNDPDEVGRVVMNVFSEQSTNADRASRSSVYR